LLQNNKLCKPLNELVQVGTSWFFTYCLEFVLFNHFVLQLILLMELKSSNIVHLKSTYVSFASWIPYRAHMIDMFWFRPYYWFNVLITSVSTLNINEWHIGNYLSHLLKLMKPNLANHNLFYLVIKLCDVIQWENPKSMLSCKLSNSFVDQFPFCSNTFIFQVFSNLLYLHLFIFLMSIWTTWMLKLPS